MIRHLDLFSGIGGFALAAHMAGGIRTIGFCDIEPFARRVLRKNFPDVPIHDDVRTLEHDKYGPFELLTGGYPCQPFSIAGRRRGKEDDRHLWPEVRRIIERGRPRWTLLENVAGHVTLGLDDVLSEMEGIGYSARPVVIPACAVDAKHRRDRVWIVGYSNDERPQGQRRELQLGEDRAEVEAPWAGSLFSDAELRGQSGKGTPRDAVHQEEDRRRKADWPKLLGERCQWSPEPRVGRVANGIPKRMDRLKALGNAIVPQVAAEILRAMMIEENSFN